MSGHATPTTWLALAGASPAPLLAWLQPWLTTDDPSSPGHPRHLVLLCAPAHWPAWQTALAPALHTKSKGGTDGSPPTAPASTMATDWPIGFHRFDWGRWHLTLCLGAVPQSLSALSCQANHVWLATEHLQAATAPTHPVPLPKALARVCAPQATLSSDSALWTAPTDGWTQAGWVSPNDPRPTAQHTLRASYQPRWPTPAPPSPTPAHALVVGAGLAGAALCASLTQRGWQVDLLDQHPGPAQGASALPVGMLSEHVTASETVLSELSRAGMVMHLRELQHWVPMGAGWQPTQVSNLRQDPSATPTAATPMPAAMVRPAALVQAWLAQAQATGLLRTHWGCAVDQLQPGPLPAPHWQALDAQGQVLAQAPHAVVTAAFDSARLLAPHMAQLDLNQPLRPVKGQLSYAPLTVPPFAPHPLRDHGVYVPCYQDSAHPTAPRLWTMGSTYERGLDNRDTTAAAHERNADSLQAMLPLAHAHLRQQQAAGELLGWAEVRCASLDRLPLVGAVPATTPPPAPSSQLATLARVPGLWTLCALGSRGLTLSKLAAELLVARMLGEPLPMEKRHADALDPARFVLKAVRKRTAHTKNQ